jgi:putative ABC transport system substrate-binding protein
LKRREFIALLGGTTLIWPLAASCSAAQSGQWRIGYLSSMYGPTEYAKSFVQGLSELGYIEGKSLTLEYRFAMGKSERLAELAADLVRERVDLIVTEGTPSTLAAMHATTTIPIVFGSLQDPIEKGIVASLAHPGGNVTGERTNCRPLQAARTAQAGGSASLAGNVHLRSGHASWRLRAGEAKGAPKTTHARLI